MMQLRKILFYLLINAPIVLNAQIADTTAKDTSSVVIFSLSADNLESASQNQDISPLLQSTRDVFASIAGFNFSNARYQIRGLESDQYIVMMNNVPMNDPELGWNVFAFWGGLNDVTRYPESQFGLGASPTTFSGPGGYSNISLRSSEDPKGSRFSYASTNRIYRNRVMFTHSTGVMENGWSLTASGSYRWSQEGYVPGTYFSGGSYFLSLEKKVNANHSIGFAGFGAPTLQGRAGIAIQEAYDLTGTNYYNPYWGYQTDGNSGQRKIRNARERENHRPSVFLSHYYKHSSGLKLTSTIYSTFGKTGNTNLNWYDAQDPRPDYYRNLPSYFSEEDPNAAAALAASWRSNNPSVAQINWDALYNANYKNLYSLENANGISGNDILFNRSKYIIEEYRVDPFQLGLNVLGELKLTDNLSMSSGLTIDRYKSRNFKVLKDLLGGDFWVDVDQFAEQTFLDPNAAQNNTETPNRTVAEGEEFGYNYEMHVNSEDFFVHSKFSGSRVDGYAALSLSHTQFYREGLWQNGRFLDNSLGKGTIYNFINYGLKGGITYKISGRHFITLNALQQTKAPLSRNIYVSPRTREDVVNNLENMDVQSADIGYVVRYPGFRSRLTAYYTSLKNGTYAQSFYHEEFRNFVNFSMTGVDQLYYGIEFGAEVNLSGQWVATTAFGTGEYIYNSQPLATITADNSANVLAQDRKVYWKNYHIGGMPQTAASIGIKYNSPKFWFIGTNFNLYTNVYVDPNPDRRTAEAVDRFVTEDPQWNQIIGETIIHTPETHGWFNNNYTLDFFAGYSKKLGSQYLRFNLNINNALNNQSLRTGGFEQLRYDSNDIDKFPPRFSYMFGVSYFGMITYQF